jgi:hypothetical protein
MAFALSTTSGAGTIAISGTTVTGTGTNFQPSDIGKLIKTGSNVACIVARASTTSVTIDKSYTVAAGASYTYINCITQSGTNTSLSGLEGVSGITRTVTNANSPTHSYAYFVDGSIAPRLDVTGTLTIDPRYESIHFINQARTGTVNAGGDTTTGSTLHAQILASKVTIQSGGTLNVGASNLDTVYKDLFKAKTWITADSNFADASGVAGLIYIYSGGTFNHEYGSIVCDIPPVMAIAGSSGYLKYCMLWAGTESPTATQTRANSIVQYEPNFSIQNSDLMSVRLDTRDGAVALSNVGLINSSAGIILRQTGANVLQHTGIKTSTTNTAEFIGTVASEQYKVKNVSTGLAGKKLITASSGAGATMLVKQGVDFSVKNSSGTGIASAIVSMQDAQGTPALYTNTVNASGVSTAETEVSLGLDLQHDTNRTFYSANSDDRFTFYAWKYDYAVGSAAALLQGLSNVQVNIVCLADSNVTLTQAQAAALSTIATLSDLYDAAKNWKCNVSNITYPTISTQLITANGTTLDLGSRNLVIDATAVSAISVNTGTNTVTIKASTLSPSAKFTKIQTTGTVTFANGAQNGGFLLQDGSGSYVPLYISGFVSGSRLRIYNITDSAEIYNNVVNATSYSQVLTISNNKNLEIRIAYQSGTAAKKELKITGTLTTAAGFTASVTQEDCAVYIGNGINGSNVTEFSADFPNIEINVNDADNTTTVQRLFAWYKALLMTADGIRNFFQGLEAEDTVNYVVNTTIVNLKIDNIKTTPLLIYGARLYRDNNTTIISATSNNVQLDPGKAFMSRADKQLIRDSLALSTAESPAIDSVDQLLNALASSIQA